MMTLLVRSARCSGRLFLFLSRLFPFTNPGDLLGEELLHAVGAETVAEFRIGMLLDVSLYLIPISLVVANFFAGLANRQQAAEGLHIVQRLFQVQVRLSQYVHFFSKQAVGFIKPLFFIAVVFQDQGYDGGYHNGRHHKCQVDVNETDEDIK